jgi:AcrR family transcriptional regulator
MKKTKLQKTARVRAPTTVSAKGRARAEQILAAAQAVLIEKDYTQFSLRNIAAHAGIHLANLQYYFPTKDAIIHAFVDYIVEQYAAKYEQRFQSLPKLPYPRFVAMLDFLIEDIYNPQTRRFFVQVWALFDTADESGRGLLLNELYAHYIARIAGYVSELNPALTPGVCQQRAAMIAAMIDGMMLMLIDADAAIAPGEPGIQVQLRAQLLRIAMDP